MSPASGPVQNPKVFPAAVEEDQEMLINGEDEPIVLGPIPFSSPDPATDAQRMLPLEDGTSAYEARLAVGGGEGTDYNSMSTEELKALADERNLDVEGTGSGGNVLKADLLQALKENDAENITEEEFVARINAASTQEELDDAAQAYEDSGQDYGSVDEAIEAKQTEIDEAS